jgi:hypothetical protein
MYTKNSRNHIRKPYTINSAISLTILCVQRTSMELIASIPARIPADHTQAFSLISFNHQTREPGM